MAKFAGCLVVWKKSFLMLLRDKKESITNPNRWGVLGGMVEEGENFQQAMVRELKEEANIDVRDFKLLGYYRRDDISGAFYVTYLSPEQVLDIELGDEGQTLGFFSLNNLKQADLAGITISMMVERADALQKILDRKEPKPEELGLSAN